MNKKNYRPLTGQILTLLLFWSLFAVLIAAALVVFVIERKTIEGGGTWLGHDYSGTNHLIEIYNHPANFVTGSENKPSWFTGKLFADTNSAQYAAAKALAGTNYPIIGFSLMSFTSFFDPATSSSVNPIDFWSNLQTSINTAYSYLFITFVIALVAVVMYFIMIIKSIHIWRMNSKMNLWSREYDTVRMIQNQMYLNFTVNLAIIFSFFNFLSTLIAGVYGIFLILISLCWSKYRTLVLPAKWWTSSTFSLLITVVVYQNVYTLGKSLFLNYFNVNIDLLVQIIFPIGTTAVIITLFIKNMYSSKVSGVKTTINNILTQSKKMDDFYEVKGVETLNDYTFVTQLPIIFTSNIRVLDKAGEEKLLMAIFKLIRQVFAAKTTDKEKKFLMYHFFINIKTQDQLIELHNSIKLISEHKTKKEQALEAKKVESVKVAEN